jgi:hypothetical protein
MPQTKPGKSNRTSHIDCIAAIALIAMAATCRADPQTHVQQGVEYFYEEVRGPISLVRDMIGVARQCEKQFGRSCELPPGSAGESLKRIETLFGALKLAPNPSPSPSLRSPQEARDRAVQLRDKFLMELRVREMQLIAKSIAVAQECPSETFAPDLIFELPEMEAANFIRFWKVSETDFNTIRRTLSEMTWSRRNEMQNHWTTERCAAASAPAIGVLRSFYEKVAPFGGGRKGEIPLRERLGAAAAFAWQIAYRLEAEADPGVRHRVESIEESR